MPKRNLCIRKYDGDDMYSYAVFRSEDVRGYKGGVIFFGEATPLIAGLGRAEAEAHKKELENKPEPE